MNVIMDEAALREAERVLRSKGFGRDEARRITRALSGLTGEDVIVLANAFDPIVQAAIRRWFVPAARTIVEMVLENALTTSRAAPPLLDLKGVARRLNVSERSVERLIASGHLVPLWVGESRRFAPEAIEAFLRRYAVRGRARKKT